MRLAHGDRLPLIEKDVDENEPAVLKDPSDVDDDDMIFDIGPKSAQELADIIAKEKPDALLPNLGGQSGLNLSSELHRAGVLAEHDVTIEPADVVREVGIFADKADISEEIVRLQTHIDQFSEIINSGQGDGRKLEFFSQEMLRETNTIRAR